MTTQTATAQAVNTALNLPLGMPAGSVKITENVWAALVPVVDWCNTAEFSDHLLNEREKGIVQTKKDGSKTVRKGKEHLKAQKITTDLQRTVIACLDDQGRKTKLDGHCRAKVWEAELMAKPEDGNVICYIHVLPKGQDSLGEYAEELLCHAVNEAGKQKATERNKVAQRWANVRHGFASDNDFVVNAIGKTAFKDAKRAVGNSDGAYKVSEEFKEFSDDLKHNLKHSIEARRLAASFEYPKPVADKTIQDTEARKDKHAREKLAYSSITAAAFLVCFYINKEAAAVFFRQWGKTSAPVAVKEAYQLAYNAVNVAPSDKVRRSEKIVDKFIEWSGDYWEANKDEWMDEEETAFAAWTDKQLGKEEKKEGDKGQTITTAERIADAKARLAIAEQAGLTTRIDEIKAELEALEGVPTSQDDGEEEDSEFVKAIMAELENLSEEAAALEWGKTKEAQAANKNKLKEAQTPKEREELINESKYLSIKLNLLADALGRGEE